MNNQFTFEGKQKRVLIGMMVLGLVCLALSFFDNAVPHHSRFWTNYLHNTVFFTGIAFTSMFIMTASIIAQAGWFTVFKRLWEAYTQFLIVGLLLMLVVAAGLWGDLHIHSIYIWANDTVVASDSMLQGKVRFFE